MRRLFSWGTLVALTATTVFMYSCQRDIPSEGSHGEINSGLRFEPDPDKITPIVHDADGEIQGHVDELKWNIEDAEQMRVKRPDGTEENVFLVDGCIELTREQYQDLMEQNADPRQYHTYNLVSFSGSRNISVIGYTGGSFALTSVMQQGLQYAINNLNAVPGLDLNFNLTFSSSTNADIVVYHQYQQPAAGGVAGFPYSNGDPYKWVQIYSGMDNYNYNVNEHVANHEIMHCIGFRHTDWATRQSCNGTGESENPYGAVYIPGTNSGYDAGSIMLACFSSSEDGELGTYDKVALQYLY
jgi:hypothetical protein